MISRGTWPTCSDPRDGTSGESLRAPRRISSFFIRQEQGAAFPSWPPWHSGRSDREACPSPGSSQGTAHLLDRLEIILPFLFRSHRLYLASMIRVPRPVRRRFGAPVRGAAGFFLAFSFPLRCLRRRRGLHHQYTRPLCRFLRRCGAPSLSVSHLTIFGANSRCVLELT